MFSDQESRAIILQLRIKFGVLPEIKRGRASYVYKNHSLFVSCCVDEVEDDCGRNTGSCVKIWSFGYTRQQVGPPS